MNLKESLEKIGVDAAHIFEVVPCAIFTIDMHMRITSWNYRAEKITGYALEEVLGKRCSILGSEVCEACCNLFSEDIPKPISGIECEITTKDGHQKIVSKRVALLKDDNGDIVGGVESFEDITERKKADEILKKRADIPNFLDHPVYLVDRNLRYLFGNKKLLERLNLSSAEELIGKEYHRFHTEEQTKEFKRKIDDVFKNSKTLHYKYTSLRSEEETFLRTLSPSMNAEGEITAVLVLSEPFDTSRPIDIEKLVTICAYCKRVLDKKSNWQRIESYCANNLKINFSHGMCPTCAEEARKELDLIKVTLK